MGKIGGMQRVSLDVNGCIYLGTAIHELMHAVGFYHEHTRNDRDSYLYIYYSNIIPGTMDVETKAFYLCISRFHII